MLSWVGDMLSPGEVEILMTYNMDLLHQKVVLTLFLVHVLYEQEKNRQHCLPA